MFRFIYLRNRLRTDQHINNQGIERMNVQVTGKASNHSV